MKFLKCIDSTNRWGTIPQLIPGHLYMCFSKEIYFKMSISRDWLVLTKHGNIVSYAKSRFE